MADDGYPYPGTSQITTAAEWEGFFSAVQLDGVVSGLDLSLNAGARTAIVSAGAAYLRGFYKPVTAPTATPVPAASLQDRVDRLVMRLDRGAATAADYIKPVVLPGTAGVATPPALTWQLTTTGVWDLPIGRWTSTAAGALTNLVDERYFLGGSFTSASRTAGVLPAYPPRVELEKDTGKIFRSDGNAWTQVLEDTGWVGLTMNGPEGSAWTGSNARIRRMNGVCHLRFSVKRWANSGLGTDDADGSAPITLTSEFRPTVDEYGFGWHSRSPIGIRVESGTGAVRLFPLTADIPAGRTVLGSMTWLMG
jgi:hypothetical protein